MFYLNVCKDTTYMSGAHRDQKRVLALWELVMDRLYAAMWVPGLKLRYSARVAIALNQWDICSSPNITYFTTSPQTVGMIYSS